MAVTQFEACDARRALVCWDEPAIKASFQLSMVTPVDREAISNTPVLSTLVRPSKSNPKRLEKVWQFDETPVMSTYLLGMVVGEFDFVSGFTKEGVVVRVYTPVGRSDRGKFALRVATQCLSFFTEKFGIPYPLAKLDMMAIPDFNGGAMENWGVVTYREMRLLIDDQASSLAQKTATARTVCHELAHQWFGNLVTMEWWTELWLKEGFARFLEFEAVHDIFPEWNVWGSFVQDITMATAMQKDAMESSHPIEVIVHHPDEVDQIFDVISYAKGASVIRMLANFIGVDKFYVGMHNYLTKFAYGNAKTVDLWQALEAASGLNITAMAHTWTTQMGFPVVTVTKDGPTISLTQQRFLANGAEDTVSKWDVPLTYITPSAGVHNAGIWVASQPSIRLDIGDAPWVKVNASQTGFYLVNYPSELWTALETPVAQLELDTVDRVSLLHSIFVLARAGLVATTDALQFSQAYAAEPEYLVWKELSENLAVYLRLFKHETWFPAFQAYIQRLYSNVMAQLTWNALPTDNDLTTNFRRDVIAMLAAAKDPAVAAEASTRFHASLASPSSLSADLRSIVYSIHVRTAPDSDAAFSHLQHVYETSNFIEEKLDVLGALGRFSSHALKSRALEWAVANVRSQDIQYVFGSVSADGSTVAWEYVQAQWDALSAKYSQVVVGRILCASIASFQTESDASAVEAFLVGRPQGAFARPLATVLENIRTKAAMYARDVEPLAAWIQTL
ncbi:hypothetical protein H310_11772 [Aphanomyces invadans]|uniref:Aminopeptidase n=1 Tax=Aphanomyces invadans TaxID=157072 RepID=A0A024TKE0_9STRA|nr:hypothetical protein H310_11772 [Aphanomyces invadans]ETV94444.1 hypothetical protein H310_11772 [Aphanomyces invadans]|eukprot:XP_008876759.1 hypothetical protein H310_11772 [Aphanomyces invadans]